MHYTVELLVNCWFAISLLFGIIVGFGAFVIAFTAPAFLTILGIQHLIQKRTNDRRERCSKRDQDEVS